jgi:predicted flap endonuclease-1-like 5' DNA nuclease
MSRNSPRFFYFNNLFLISGLLSRNFQQAGQDGNQWWLWILLILVVLAVLVWWFWSNRKASQPSAQKIAPSTREASEPPVGTPPDDLEIIEGIGPKIAALLNEAGISTFEALAETDAARLVQILTDGGIRLADPATWGEQARLAAAGDEDGLKALQENLKGGRRE